MFTAVSEERVGSIFKIEAYRIVNKIMNTNNLKPSRYYEYHPF
jgi:hypothetical protein